MKYLAVTWMNFENIMLSERSQTQKDKYCVILFIWNIQYTYVYIETDIRQNTDIPHRDLGEIVLERNSLMVKEVYYGMIKIVCN